MDPYFFSEGDETDFDGNGGSSNGNGGEGGSGDSTNFVARLTENALSGTMFDRKAAARSVLEAFRQTCLTEEDVSSVMAVIDKLVEDPEQSVRTEVMEQLPQIAVFCHEEGPYLDYVVPQHIIPHIVKLLTDKFTQVRKTSQAALLLLLERGIIAPSQVEEHVCPVILEYTGPRAHEDYRTEIAQFMSRLAPLVGKEIIVKCYLDRFCHLCQDALFQVRKVCATSMGDIASVIGTNLTEKILIPHFSALCIDEVWGVRKGCAEIFTAVSSICRLSTRKGILTQLFVDLLQDPSRWVRVAACQTLGPFITTFTTFLTEESPPFTPEFSGVEKMFLEGLPQGTDTGLDNVNNNVENEKQDNERSLSHLSVISQCPTELALSLTTISDEIRLQKQKLLDNLPPPSEPMDVDDTEAQKLIVKSNPNDQLNSGDSNNASLSFEEERKLAYDCEANKESLPESEKNENLCKNIVSSDKSSIKFESSNQTSNSLLLIPPEQQNSPNVLISSCEKEPGVIHIHVEKEKPKNLDFSSVITSHYSSNETTSEVTNTFNTWQYWRTSFPEIELDINMAQSGLTNVHVRAKVVDPNNQITYSSELSVNVVRNEQKILVCDDSQKDSTQVPQNPQELQMQINTTSSSSTQLLNTDSSSEKVVLVDSTISKTTVSIAGVAGNVSDVHRSYMNLYNATRDQGFEDGGLDSIKMGDNGYDDDSDEQLSATYPFGDEYSSGHDSWTTKSTRPKLLSELPKAIPNHQEIVPDSLLDHFISMCRSSHEYQSVDTELPSFCVYNLPAVVLTLGPQNWSLLRECYEALACNMQWKIRFTLASSLHEIANILGPELAERDLVPFYNATVKDVDEVRIGILKNLANFIKTLGSEARRKCLETLSRFVLCENSRNWRFRMELAEQLQKLTEMYEADEIYKHLCPVSMDLIVDRVAEVRKKALSVVPYLVNRLNYSFCKRKSSEASLVREFLLHLVKSLCHSEQWVRRQAFAGLAGQFVEIGAMSPAQFAQDILPHLISLSEDKVPNVRLVVAQSISYYVMPLDYFSDPSNPHKEILLSTLSKLQNDEDSDVRYYSKPLYEDDEEELYDEEVSYAKSC